MKFTNGVIDFLNEKIKAPINNDIKRWHDVYMHILSDDVITKWESSPTLKMVYCSLGIWEDNEHIISHKKNAESIIMSRGIFESADLSFIDAKELADIINGNDSGHVAVMGLVDSMPLPQVNKVDNSSVVMCNAGELINLITNEGILRRNIFTDNVRDYQGDTTINQEIRNTLNSNSQEFILLNNGITIVCDEMREVNRKITIKNPQVVNGCQTCNVLYNAYKSGIKLDKAYVIVKVIASTDSSIINNIIKGTNRQNIVYDEAFEVTRDFHKFLEEYFKFYQIDNFEKIYYESLLIKSQ